ncbi:hypothetical protein BCON_0048g00200 [Botryotinia convoluta]|uniref:Uncharacterized protein n=1 Tax=Botryotinia convoluta TaxID=54673 RepID=A0A4Z1IEX7_9HELO|nr:hypothetical protein BCON_0048g00200 [Botryotinia convoluta]
MAALKAHRLEWLPKLDRSSVTSQAPKHIYPDRISEEKGRIELEQCIKPPLPKESTTSPASQPTIKSQA